MEHLLEQILTSQCSTTEGSDEKKNKEMLAKMEEEIKTYPSSKNDKDKPMYILERCLDGNRWDLVSTGWNRGTVEQWNRGTVEPWNRGTVEQWNSGTVEPSNSGTVEQWNSGTVEPSNR